MECILVLPAQGSAFDERPPSWPHRCSFQDDQQQLEQDVAASTAAAIHAATTAAAIYAANGWN